MSTYGSGVPGGGADAEQWYWGAVVRVDEADPLLRRLTALGPPPGVRVQAPGTAHLTLLYAPVRDAGGAAELARRAGPIARTARPFRLRVGGLGEFPSDERVVAWLGVEDESGGLEALRSRLCTCDQDCLPHQFIPHLTLVYGDHRGRYASFRDDLLQGVDGVAFDVFVESLYIGGFPAGGHPARDLVYRLELPFDVSGL